ncbi:MAG: translational GTPase TypA [Bacteroidota bacterium]
MKKKEIRNVAVIAHVDHGKTTLMDQLMREGGMLDNTETSPTRLMDSNDLEKERGITILSKCTTLEWQEYRFNMVDTPGHADFGGEVERILGMVDGVLLLVDASEGVMPQTKFVLTKALAQGLRPIVVINKMDKPDQRAEEVFEEVFELFMCLQATEAQLDFPLLYASAKNGWAITDEKHPKENMQALFQAMAKHVPSPQGDPNAPLQMLVTTIDSAPFLGRLLTGRIHQGTIKENMAVRALDLEGNIVEQGRITKISINKGLEPLFIPQAAAGDIVTIAGLIKGTVSHTIAAPTCTTPLPAQPIDPPTLSMQFSANTSPFLGRDGNKLTSSLLKERLWKEMEHNVSIQVSQTPDGEGFQVAGRGELQLGVLIETMRREGFEMAISRPKVLFKTDPTNGRLEPIEEVQIDLDETYMGTIIDHLNKRYGEVQDVQSLDGNRLRIKIDCPTRGLIGFNSELLNLTRGTGIMCRSFKAYEKYKGPLDTLRNGVLISLSKGKALAYALMNIEPRGTLFISPGTEVYEGMIIGEHNRKNDLSVNPMKGKKLTNMRAAGSDKEVKLTPPRTMTLEEALCYIQDDECLEVTPQHLRLRKKSS